MTREALHAAGSTAVGSHRDVGRRTLTDEIAALRRLHDALDESFDAAVDAMAATSGKVLALGVGKSGHVAQKVAATLRSAGLQALYLSASDSLHGDLGVVSPTDTALLFSKSGAASELMTLLPHLRSRGATLIAIVGVPGSPIARESRHRARRLRRARGLPAGRRADGQRAGRVGDRRRAGRRRHARARLHLRGLRPPAPGRRARRAPQPDRRRRHVPGRGAAGRRHDRDAQGRGARDHAHRLRRGLRDRRRRRPGGLPHRRRRAPPAAGGRQHRRACRSPP